MGIVLMILQAIIWLIVGDAILSWVQSPEQLPRKITSQITGVLYAPIHAVIKPSMTGGLDLSPIIVIFGLQFLMGFLGRL